MQKTNKKILIVEDDPNFVFILKEKFSAEGFSVLTAQDGKEGLSAIEREKPDLVISDVLLPLLDGVDMAKKARQKSSELPVIFLTNVKDPSSSYGAKKIKNVDYIIKSDVRLDDILAIAKKRLKIK